MLRIAFLSKSANFCTFASIWLICTKNHGSSKYGWSSDALSQGSNDLFLLIGESSWDQLLVLIVRVPTFPFLGAGALKSSSLLRCTRINCLKSWPTSYYCRKHFRGFSLDSMTKWTRLQNKIVFKPKKQLNNSATFNLLSSTQCSTVKCSTVQ